MLPFLITYLPVSDMASAEDGGDPLAEEEPSDPPDKTEGDPQETPNDDGATDEFAEVCKMLNSLNESGDEMFGSPPDSFCSMLEPEYNSPPNPSTSTGLDPSSTVSNTHHQQTVGRAFRVELG